MLIERAGLLHVMPRAASVVDAWLPGLNEGANAFEISSPKRIAMWVANIAHESAELTKLEEDLRYTHADRLLAVYPKRFVDLTEAERYVALGPEAIASHVYADRLGNGDEASGNGWDYRARGPIGITFKANYMAGSIACCGDADTLLKNPEFVALPEFGAALAAWYWETRKCNEYADADDFDGTCDMVNIGRKTIARGDSNGFHDRQHYLDLGLEVWQ